MTSNNSPLKLTEFSPHSDDRKAETNIFKRFFKKTAKLTNEPLVPEISATVNISNVTEATIPSSARTAPKVLQRLTQIISGSGKTYRDSDFRQYWMPDDNCHVCYDCTAKFNAVRRRHHCRICGQIFCSQCCNKQIPGPAMGFSGFLRCCNYCIEIVQQYMEVNSHYVKGNSINENIAITANSNMPQSNDLGNIFTHSRHGSLNLSSSIFDENFRRCNSCENLTTQNSMDFNSTIKNIPGDANQLKNLWLSLLEKLPRHNIRSRLQVVDFCFTGEDIVNSLITNDTAKYREHALIFGQSFLDSKFIQNLNNNDSIFRDSAQSFYKSNKLNDKRSSQESLQKFDHIMTFGSYPFEDKEDNETTEVDEPLWVQKIQRQDDKSGNEDKIICSIDENLQLPENIDKIDYFSKNSVQLISQNDQKESLEYYSEIPSQIISEDTDSLDDDSVNLLYDSFQQELKNLQTDQITKITNKLLLRSKVSLNWAPVIINFASKIAELIKPNKRLHDEMDIRNYVRIKKIPGGTSENWKIVNGVIFSKNVAHRKMRQDISGAKILLLGCPVEYQRVENKMTSLEPLILQEDEFLKKITNRISDLEPDVVLAEKSVSRIAQNYLFEAGITLVLNVKKSIMLRLARLTQATIVTSIDGLVGRTSTLGFCPHFYISTYNINNDLIKSIMCFESDNPHLACSVVLRGANFRALKEIKKILNFIIFASNNSRLELSYLIHEGASYNKNINKNTLLNSLDLKSNKVIHTEDILVNSDKNILEINSYKNEVEDKKFFEIMTTSNYNQSIRPTTEFQIYEIDKSDIVKTENIKVIKKNDFKFFLETEIVSISPLINIEPIYFESELGINSPFRKYFSVPTLESMLLLNDKPDDNNIHDDVDVHLLNCINVKSNYCFDKHQFTNCQLNYPASCNKVQNLLADYRAFGGRLPLLNKPPVNIRTLTNSKSTSLISNKESKKKKVPTATLR